MSVVVENSSNLDALLEDRGTFYSHLMFSSSPIQGAGGAALDALEDHDHTRM